MFREMSLNPLELSSLLQSPNKVKKISIYYVQLTKICNVSPVYKITKLSLKIKTAP